MCGIMVLLRGIRVLQGAIADAASEESSGGCDDAAGATGEANRAAVDGEENAQILSSQQYVAMAQLLRRRGPSQTHEICVSAAECGSSPVAISAVGSVLHMRGDEIVAQPFCQRGSDSFLLWNGEVYGGALDCCPQAAAAGAGVSDTAAMFDLLRRMELAAARDGSSGDEFAARCRDALEADVAGCYAFMYFASDLNVLCFGRDPLGRRSLIVASSCHGAGFLLVTSVLGIPSVEKRSIDGTTEKAMRGDTEGVGCGASTGLAAAEVPIRGIYYLPIDSRDGQEADVAAAGTRSVRCARWTRPHTLHPLSGLRLSPYRIGANSSSSNADELLFRACSAKLHQVLSRVQYRANLVTDSTHEVALRYLEALAFGVGVRIAASRWADLPVMIPFSGGVDCTVIAALALLLTVEEGTAIELVNVASGADPATAPDRVSAERSALELTAFEAMLSQKSAEVEQRGVPSGNDGDPPGVAIASSSRIRFVEIDISSDDAAKWSAHVRSLLHPLATVMDNDIGLAIWFATQGRGGSRLDLDDLRRCGRTGVPSQHYRLPAQVSAHQDKSSPPTVGGDPDFTALVEVLLLQGSDLASATGPEAEAEAEAAKVLLSTLGKEFAEQLTHEWRRQGYKRLGDYLDDAEKTGIIDFGGTRTGKWVRLRRAADKARAQELTRLARAQCSAVPYTCEGKVVLLGMGADETLGGYTRHRVRHERHSAASTQDRAEGNGVDATSELQKDFEKLWRRNLGRDDRIVADSGREARFPFLDEHVLATLSTFPSEQVADFRLPPGVGEKKVLRTAARMLGLQNVARLQKRAIQFGTRVADRKQRGSQPLLQHTAHIPAL